MTDTIIIRTVETRNPVNVFKDMKNMKSNDLKRGCPEMRKITSIKSKQVTHCSCIYFINFYFIPGTAERAQSAVRQKRSRYDGKPELLPRVAIEPVRAIGCQWLFFLNLVFAFTDNFFSLWIILLCKMVSVISQNNWEILWGRLDHFQLFV